MQLLVNRAENIHNYKKNLERIKIIKMIFSQIQGKKVPNRDLAQT